MSPPGIEPTTPRFQIGRLRPLDQRDRYYYYSSKALAESAIETRLDIRIKHSYEEQAQEHLIS